MNDTKKYQVKFSSLCKYNGNQEDSTFTHNEIKETTRTSDYVEYGEALKHYLDLCVERATHINMPICFSYVDSVTLIQLKSNGSKIVRFQFNCSSI